MNTNFSMLFYLKKAKNQQPGDVPIYVRITMDGSRSECSTSRQCDSRKWCSRSGRAKGSKEDARILNSYLDQLQNKVYTAHRDLVSLGKDFDASDLKNLMAGKSQKIPGIIEVFREHNQKIKSLVGKEYAEATAKRYETSLRHTVEYLGFQYGKEDLEVNRIDHAFVSNYDYFLRTNRGCANNSAVKYLKNFSKIIKICLSNGWLATDPFAKIKNRIKPVNRVFLSDVELQRLSDKTFSNARLNQVKDIFLFCCYTGLAYIDIKLLKNDAIATGVDGDQWVFTHRQKTGVPSSIPLLPQALALMEKYRNHPMCLNKGCPFPVPSNQKTNEYLKEIADICGINKALTSHIARHTFATTVTLSNGVPIESVSRMLGHSSIKQTQHYAKILDKKVSQDMMLLKAAMAKKDNLNKNKKDEN